MAKLFAIIFSVFLAAQIIITDSFTKRESVSRIICAEAEKQALLSFKQDLVDSSSQLSSWVAEEDDCCEWDRIVCNNITGHVTELNLNEASLTGKINPSLLTLKHLTHLNLSNNEFEGIQIPSFLGSLVSLRYLDLSYAGFEGLIPSQLGNLSDLHYLAIGSGSLYAKNIEWISGLSSLEYLHMRNVNFSEASDHLLLAINTLPSLVELTLAICDLHRTILIPSPINLTSIEVLDLSENALEIPLLCDLLRNMSHLQSLDLSWNGFPSKIPNCLYTLPNLQSLYLSASNLGGVISQEIANLTSIENLYLNENSLQGNLPASMGSLCNLKDLALGVNKFSGEISEALKSMSGCLSNNIRSLYLDSCSFFGEITDQIGDFKSLVTLYLPHNNISGSIPVSLSSLSNLNLLDISSNQLQGVVSEAHFSNLTNLKALDASLNLLTLRVSPDWIPPFHLLHLDLSSWKLGPQFPLWLKSQKDLLHVELSNTGISGVIPSWFWNLSSRIDWLGLSNNKLYGEIPDLHGFDELEVVDMSSNGLTGKLPRISSNLEWLDLSNNFFSGDIASLVCNPMGNHSMLRILKLGDNILEGNIPDCWMHWPPLQVIDLDNNKLSGEIPASMGLLTELESLHIRNNSLTGEIPNSLRHCSSLNGLDLGLNEFVGSVPEWVGSLPDLSVLILRSNNLKGHIPIELCALVELQILDIADNNLFGTIPNCLQNLFVMTDSYKHGTYGGFFYYGEDNEEYRENAILMTKGRENSYDNTLDLVSILDLSNNNLSGEIPEGLASLQKLQHLNLSTNHLRGSIPNKIGNMSALESLDLSQNKLTGKIPPSMSHLHFLNYLNLSYNSLSGEIPKSTQLQSLPPSSFFGNQLLCGDPLPKRCKEDHNTTPHLKSENRETEYYGEEYWFKLGVGMGFGVGFSGVIAPLVLCGFWRHAYFYFFQEYIWFKIVDCFISFKHIV